MDRKQKEALVLALAEKGKTYREITKEAGVSPNTIKAVLNKAGLTKLLRSHPEPSNFMSSKRPLWK